MRLGPLVALIAALLLPFTAGAQSLGGLGSIGGNTVSITMDPQYPSPYSQVTISFISDYINLANATLSVSVGGKETYKGSVHPVPIQLGGAGSITNVQITISSVGTNYNQTLRIQPQDVVLIAEPVSFAPPLYPGKSSVPLQGNVRIVAVANLKGTSGKMLSPTTYSYVWKIDGVQMTDSSGINKSSIIAISPLQYRGRTVSVTVMDSSGSLTGGASLSLSSVTPSVRVYENDPLLGIRYDHALSGSYTISGAEATLYAAPFSLSTIGGAPVVQWFLNGSPAQTGNSVTLRPTGSGRGDASLSLVASGDQSTTATANLSLIFGAQPSTNLFGL